jgi:hypothetical protein
MATLRELRLHLEQRDGTLRRVANARFTAADASLYLMPFALTGRYVYGQKSLELGEASATIDLGSDVTATEKIPKISIHETGRVHVESPASDQVGPVYIPPLTALRGEHIATVQWDSTEALPLPKSRRESGEADVVFGVPDDIPAGAVLIYANGAEQTYVTEYVHFDFPVGAADGSTVYFGFTASAKDVLGDGVGVTALAGFDPTIDQGQGDPDEFLFVRGS